MTPEQMAALTPAEMESTCICGDSLEDHAHGMCTASDRENPNPPGSIWRFPLCPCDRYRSVWNAGEAQDEQRYSRP